MAFEDRLNRGPTSPAHDFFDLMFEGADLFSGFWQPFLKSAGRWHLEIAQLTAKQARATMELSHQLAESSKPDDVTEAFRTYWGNIHACYESASRNIGTALVRAAPQAIVLDIPQAPRRHVRDTLELGKTSYERKVA